MMDEKVYNLISSAVSCMHDSEYIAAQSCATIAQAISLASIAESLEKLAKCTTKDDAISTFVENK